MAYQRHQGACMARLQLVRDGSETFGSIGEISVA